MFNKLKWFLLFLLEWRRRRSYPIAKIGMTIALCAMSPWLSTGISLSFKLSPNNFFSQFSFDLGEITMIQEVLSLFLIVFGVFLIIYDIRRTARKARSTAKVLLTGMMGSSTRFPNELLSFAEQTDSRETVCLDNDEEIDGTLGRQIAFYNSQVKSQLYTKFILSHECKKFYIGGLARVPFLVAYGAAFRAASANVIYFDRIHQNGKWRLLNDVDESVSLCEYNCDSVSVSENGDVGIAVGFTHTIRKEQLPEFLVNNTLILETGLTTSRNLIMNQDNLHRLSSEVQQIIDKLSSFDGCKKIHLFLSVQSTLALDIGRRFQEGMHKKWVIHNYDGSTGKYNWAIELSKDGISEYLRV